MLAFEIPLILKVALKIGDEPVKPLARIVIERMVCNHRHRDSQVSSF
jgi:hypothetical protein